MIKFLRTILYTILILILLAGAVVSYFVRDARVNGEEATFANISNSISNLKTVVDLKPYFEGNGQERTFLLLFQNDMEIRPGGGYIGSLGTITIEDGNVKDISVFNSHNIDNLIYEEELSPDSQYAEVHEKEYLGIQDSNWSPDFEINAREAAELYEIFGEKSPENARDIDGVIAINTHIFEKILEYTGPVQVDGYPVEFTAENGALELEKWVEIDALSNGADQSSRKDIMKDLAKVIADKALQLSPTTQLELADSLFMLMEEKDIMAFSFDETIQAELERQGWAGKINTTHDNDYLMIVESNMQASKADPYIEREIEYFVNFSRDNPIATLKITLEYSPPEENFMYHEFQKGFLKIYVPEGSTLFSINGEYRYDYLEQEELGKETFGIRYLVESGEKITYTFRYQLPDSITEDNYDLLIEEQSGVDRVYSTAYK